MPSILADEHWSGALHAIGRRWTDRRVFEMWRVYEFFEAHVPFNRHRVDEIARNHSIPLHYMARFLYSKFANCIPTVPEKSTRLWCIECRCGAGHCSLQRRHRTIGNILLGWHLSGAGKRSIYYLLALSSTRTSTNADFFFSFLQVEKEGENRINVADLLLELRQSRMGLIQTADQLYFSYQAIIEGIKHFNDQVRNL